MLKKVKEKSFKTDLVSDFFFLHYVTYLLIVEREKSTTHFCLVFSMLNFFFFFKLINILKLW